MEQLFIVKIIRLKEEIHMKKSSIGKITVIKVNDTSSDIAEITASLEKNMDKEKKANERSGE